MKRLLLVLLLVLLSSAPAEGREALKSLGDQIPTPPALQELKTKIFTPEGLLMTVGGIIFLVWMNQDGSSQKGRLATSQWAGAKEKASARKTALQQIRERQRNSVAAWINRPKLKQRKDGAIVAKPTTQTVFVPDVQKGTAVMGAPGVGKSRFVIDPMIRSFLEQGNPVVLYDFKFPHGQAEVHAAYAESLGYEVKYFAPGFAGSETCNLLDFLRDADDGETAGQIAKTLNQNFSSAPGRTNDPFFQMSGDQLIKATLQLAKLTTLPDVLTCQSILAIDSTELIKRVIEAPNLSPWVKVSWDQFLSMKSSEKTASSVAATAALMFSNFASPDLLGALCGPTTIPLDLNGKQLLIFGMDQNRRDIISPIVAAVMEMVITRNVARKRNDPLGVFLDEVATIQLPKLPNWLNESRSAGFCGVLGFQNMSQLDKAYTRETTRAILTGCGTKIVFNPGEYETAEYFAKFIGEEEIRYEQKSRSVGKSGNSRSYSPQERTKKLISPEELLKLRQPTPSFPIADFVLINPAYASAKESSVPARLRVKLSKHELTSIALGEAGFPAFIDRSRSMGRQDSFGAADLAVRQVAIAQVIPPLSGGNQSKQKQPAVVGKPAEVPKTFADVLKDSAAQFDALVATEEPGF
ncbi:type IV secretory system conjugative DNA transfer family protein [Leptolyngbya sp. AN02str]|uniref:type IV secretory system conjugative DNA transfer family protein n=1 Tax=Leptolyngbya sp. AN02str TaxID=3423363 RepID=UPI003D31296D